MATSLSPECKDFVVELEKDSRCRVQYVGQGHGLAKIFDAETGEFICSVPKSAGRRALLNAKGRYARYWRNHA